MKKPEAERFSASALFLLCKTQSATTTRLSGKKGGNGKIRTVRELWPDGALYILPTLALLPLRYWHHGNLNGIPHPGPLPEGEGAHQLSSGRGGSTPAEETGALRGNPGYDEELFVNHRAFLNRVVPNL
jgi:hypothetical protein